MTPKARIRELNLATLPPGSTGRISGMAVEGVVRRELNSMGLLMGAEVRVVRRAPMGGAILVAVGSSQYALGREIAALIRVVAR